VKAAAVIACTDLARLDVADWLADATGSDPPGPEHQDRVPPKDPAGPTAGATPDRDPPVEMADWSPSDQVTRLAQELTRSQWDVIVVELAGDHSDIKAVGHDLAQHGWCDLLVGLIRVVEHYRAVLKAIPNDAKKTVKRAILDSSQHPLRAHVSERVVDIVVDRVWGVFLAAITGGVPALTALSSDELLRDLRILAVFICPAPEHHAEVREHAMKPLGDEATEILKDETKAQLAKVFSEWSHPNAHHP